MGDPGAIELVDKNLKVYYTHFGEVAKANLEHANPFLKSLSVGSGEVIGLPKHGIIYDALKDIIKNKKAR